MQLQASDGGVQGVELSAFFPGLTGSVGAHRPRLGLKVPVEVVAALHLVETTGQSEMERPRHRGDGPVQHRLGKWGRIFGAVLLWLLHPPGRQEKGQSTETFGALTHPQLEQHLQEDTATIQNMTVK